MSDDQKTSMDTLLGGLGQAPAFDWGAAELDDALTPEIEVVRFRLGEQLFAVEGQRVREVAPAVEVTPMPGAPAHILGVTVRKRQVLGELDLRRWLGLGLSSRTASSGDSAEGVSGSGEEAGRMLVLESGELVAGLVVDEVTGVEPWPAVEDARLPEGLGVQLRNYVSAARWAPGGVVLLLDVDRILEDAAVR